MVCEREGVFAPFDIGSTDISVKLDTESVIEGIVVNKADGKPVEGIKVMARSTASGIGQIGVTPGMSDKGGLFRIGGLAAGSLKIRGVDTAGNDICESVTVTVGQGAKTSDVKLETVALGYLEVVVTDSRTNRAVEDADVGADVGSSRLGSSKTDVRGRTRLALVPGKYNVNVNKRGSYKWYNHKQPVEIVSGSTAKIECRLDPMDKLRGIVRDLDGKAVAGASVRSILDPAGSTTSNADGRFFIIWNDNYPVHLIITHIGYQKKKSQ